MTRVSVSGGSASMGGSISRGDVGPPDTWDTTGYGEQADGTHPTGMHSCVRNWFWVCPDIRQQQCYNNCVITARNRNLGKVNIFAPVCHSVHGGGGAGIPACLAAGWGRGWYTSMPCRFPAPHPGWKLRGIWPGGGSPGPHPRRKLRGSGQGVSRLTSKGEFEGDLASGVSRSTPKGKLRGIWPGGGLQAHTQGGSWGGSGWEGLQARTQGVSIPACTVADPAPSDDYCCGRYASYWNAFLFVVIFSSCSDWRIWKSLPVH